MGACAHFSGFCMIVASFALLGCSSGSGDPGALNTNGLDAIDAPRHDAGGARPVDSDPPPGPTFVVGPNPFNLPCAPPLAPSCLRADFATSFATASDWTELAKDTDTVELYIMMLQWNAAITPPPYDLAELAQTFGQKRVAFQVGGIPPCRCAQTSCDACTACNTIGKSAADADWKTLTTWPGQIDEIVLDNGYTRLLARLDPANPSDPKPLGACSLDYVTTQVAAYLTELRSKLLNGSKIRFVLTDAPGLFTFPGQNSLDTYATTVATFAGTIIPVPQTPLASYLQQVQSKLSGFQVAEFATDFMDAVEFDASTHPGSRARVDHAYSNSAFIADGGADFGRMLLAQVAAQNNGMKVGVYFNAFPYSDTGKTVGTSGLQDALAKNRSVRFLVDYGNAGGHADSFRLVFWHKYPDATGPEATSATAFNVLRDQIRTAKAQIDTVGMYHDVGFDLFLAHVDDPPFQRTAWGTAGGVPLAGDWDGDGIVTVGMYDPSTATAYLSSSNQIAGDPTQGASSMSFTYGNRNSGWIPIAGDWNGDKKDTIGLYDPLTSRFMLRNTNSSGFADATFIFGAAGKTYVPLAGDWDGDGVDTVGLFETGSGTFFLRNSNTSGFADVTYTSNAAYPSTLPVVGDWDGDGHETPGLVEVTDQQNWVIDLWNGSVPQGLDTSNPDAKIFRQKGTSSGAMAPLAGRWARLFP